MNWRRVVAKFLYPDAFSIIDTKNKAIAELRSSLTISEKVATSFKQTINILESDKTYLIKAISDCENELAIESKTSLEPFKTTRTYRINGTNRKLNTWLNIPEEKAHVADWVDENLDVSELKGTIDEQAKQLRIMIFNHFGGKDIWEADEVQNTFAKPSELIEAKFKGNCNDWFTFMYYVYDYVFDDENKLYCVIGGLNLWEGYNQGNHAYCLWEHSDGKYYVIESAVGQKAPWRDYIKISLDDFGKKDYTKNFRYGRIVWLANNKKTYFQVVL